MRPGHWCSEPDPDGLLRPGAGAGLHPAYTGSSPRRWTNSASATGTGISGFEDLSFILGQPAPYSSVLVGLHGPLQTGFNDVAATADSFCLFDLEARGVAPPVREEQIRVLAQAGGAVAPGHQLGLLRVRGSTQGMLSLACSSQRTCHRTSEGRGSKPWRSRAWRPPSPSIRRPEVGRASRRTLGSTW